MLNAKLKNQKIIDKQIVPVHAIALKSHQHFLIFKIMLIKNKKQYFLLTRE
jgi:hypothetical protein